MGVAQQGDGLRLGDGGRAHRDLGSGDVDPDPVIKYFPEPEAAVAEKAEPQAEGADAEIEDEDVAAEIAEGEGAELMDAQQATPRRLSSILFSRNAPVLVVGDDAGSVDV